MSKGRELAELHRLRRLKFEEIKALVASRLGYPDLSQLSEQEADDVESAAEEATEYWAQGPAIKNGSVHRDDRLQQLLAEHQAISDRIIDLS